MNCPICEQKTEEVIRIEAENGEQAEYFACSHCRFRFRYREDGALVGAGSVTEEARAKLEEILQERLKHKQNGP